MIVRWMDLPAYLQDAEYINQSKTKFIYLFKTKYWPRRQKTDLSYYKIENDSDIY